MTNKEVFELKNKMYDSVLLVNFVTAYISNSIIYPGTDVFKFALDYLESNTEIPELKESEAK